MFPRHLGQYGYTAGDQESDWVVFVVVLPLLLAVAGHPVAGRGATERQQAPSRTLSSRHLGRSGHVPAGGREGLDQWSSEPGPARAGHGSAIGGAWPRIRHRVARF